MSVAMTMKKRWRAVMLTAVVGLVLPTAACAGDNGAGNGASTGSGADHAAGNVTIDDSHVFPESITSDAAGNLYTGSLKGIIYKASAGSQTASAWIKPDDTNKLLWVLGVLAHEASNTLWVCTTPAAFTNPPKLGDAALVAFDLTSGAFKARYVLPPASGEGAPPGATCNDMTVGQDGKVYVAETAGGQLLSLSPGASELAVETQDPLLVGIDGLAFSADDQLYVNNTRQNTLLRVNRDGNGAFESLTTLAVSEPMQGPDGLRLYEGSTFLQAETGSSKATLVTISGDNARITVIDADTGGSAAITNIGKTAYTAAGKIQYLFSPDLQGKDPGAFIIKATSIGDEQ